MRQIVNINGEEVLQRIIAARLKTLPLVKYSAEWNNQIDRLVVAGNDDEGGNVNDLIPDWPAVFYDLTPLIRDNGHMGRGWLDATINFYVCSYELTEDDNGYDQQAMHDLKHQIYTSFQGLGFGDIGYSAMNLENTEKMDSTANIIVRKLEFSAYIQYDAIETFDTVNVHRYIVEISGQPNLIIE